MGHTLWVIDLLHPADVRVPKAKLSGYRRLRRNRRSANAKPLFRRYRKGATSFPEVSQGRYLFSGGIALAIPPEKRCRPCDTSFPEVLPLRYLFSGGFAPATTRCKEYDAPYRSAR